MFLYGKASKIILICAILGILTSCSKLSKTSSKGPTRVKDKSPFVWGNESFTEEIPKKAESNNSSVEFIQPTIGFIEGEIKDNSTTATLDSKQKSDPFLLDNQKLKEINLKGGGDAPLLMDTKEESGQFPDIKVTNRDKLIDFS
ncbi:MAG: hypothetical protein VYD54_09220, partial [Bdellovibrionota bacterium]|nr:hypothetical protein [Bdellovibrionota bacterium]